MNGIARIATEGARAADVPTGTACAVGVENGATFDRACAAAFGDARPARTVVPVPALHHGYLVEVDAVATRAAP